MKIDRINPQNRECVNHFIMEHWHSTKMVIREKEIDMTAVEGIVLFENNTITGLATYIIYGDNLEITSLDSIHENRGVGTMLLREVISIAQKAGCRKVVLITTNDNINALRFYQKRGFDMAHLYRNALDISRKLKPEIPLKHEIEFEMIL